jgi:hypothetical protein
LRNDGPDQALGAGYLSNDYIFTGPGTQIALFPVAETAPCTFVFDDFPPPPGQPGFAIVTLYIGPMAPNQSVTCQLGIQAVPSATGAFTLQFEAREVSGNASDPNPANNVVQFPLQFEVPTVPVSSSFGLMALAGSLLLVGLLSVQRIAPMRRMTHQARSAALSVALVATALAGTPSTGRAATDSIPSPVPEATPLFVVDPLAPGSPPAITEPAALGAVIEYPIQLNTRQLAEHPDVVRAPIPGEPPVEIANRRFLPLSGFIILEDGQVIVDPNATDEG